MASMISGAINGAAWTGAGLIPVFVVALAYVRYSMYDPESRVTDVQEVSVRRECYSRRSDDFVWVFYRLFFSPLDVYPLTAEVLKRHQNIDEPIENPIKTLSLFFFIRSKENV